MPRIRRSLAVTSPKRARTPLRTPIRDRERAPLRNPNPPPLRRAVSTRTREAPPPARDTYGFWLRRALNRRRPPGAQHLGQRHPGNTHVRLHRESLPGFTCGAPVTKAAVNSAEPSAVNNAPSVLANVTYAFTWPVTGAKATSGLNTGYIMESARLTPEPAPPTGSPSSLSPSSASASSRLTASA